MQTEENRKTIKTLLQRGKYNLRFKKKKKIPKSRQCLINVKMVHLMNKHYDSTHFYNYFRTLTGPISNRFTFNHQGNTIWQDALLLKFHTLTRRTIIKTKHQNRQKTTVVFLASPYILLTFFFTGSSLSKSEHSRASAGCHFSFDISVPCCSSTQSITLSRFIFSYKNTSTLTPVKLTHVSLECQQFEYCMLYS